MADSFSKIDIARYFLNVKKGLTNPKKQVNRVIAFGQTAVYHDLQQFGDADNGYGIVEFANGKILTSHIGRTLTNGHESSTRVFGTKGTAVVNAVRDFLSTIKSKIDDDYLGISCKPCSAPRCPWGEI